MSAAPIQVDQADRHFKAAREALGKALTQALLESSPSVVDQLIEATRKARDDRDARAYADAAQRFAAQSEALARQAARHLDDLATRRFDPLRASAVTPNDPDELALIEEAALEEQILATDLATKLRDAGGRAYEEMTRRVATLMGREPRAEDTIDEDLHPLSARVIAKAVVRAITPITDSSRVRFALRRMLVEGVSLKMATAISSVNRQLEQAGISTGPMGPVNVGQGADATVDEPPTLTAPTKLAVARVVRTVKANVATPAAQVAPVALQPVADAEPPSAPAVRKLAVKAVVTPVRLQRESSPQSIAAASTQPVASTQAASNEAQVSTTSAAATAAPTTATTASVTPLRKPLRTSGPKVIRTIVAKPAPVADAGTTSPAVGQASSQASSATADATAHADTATAAAMSATAADASSDPTPARVVEDAVSFATSRGVAPYSQAARKAWFSTIKDVARTAELHPSERQAIDHVAQLFDYAIDDQRIPDPAKPLIWRLQKPVTTLAILDHDFISDEQRSARKIVEQIAALMTAFPERMAQEEQLRANVEAVIDSIDAAARILESRMGVLADQATKESERTGKRLAAVLEAIDTAKADVNASVNVRPLRERRSGRNRPGPEQEAAATAYVAKLIETRTQKGKLTEQSVEFLNTYWLRHLRTCYLRDGVDSAPFRIALQVIDDLMDAQSLDRVPTKRMSQTIPPLIKQLSQGIVAIGAKREDFKPFFDELFMTQLRRQKEHAEALFKKAMPSALGATGVALSGAATTPAQTVPAATVPQKPKPALPDLPSSAARMLPTAAKAPALAAASASQAAQAPQAGAKPAAKPVAAQRPQPAEPARGVPKPGESGLNGPQTIWPDLNPDLESIEDSGVDQATIVAQTERAKSGRTRGATLKVEHIDPFQQAMAGALAGSRGRAALRDQADLMQVVASLDLSDVPANAVVERDLATITRELKAGDWLLLHESDRDPERVKVAWVAPGLSRFVAMRERDRSTISVRWRDFQDMIVSGQAVMLRKPAKGLH